MERQADPSPPLSFDPTFGVMTSHKWPKNDHKSKNKNRKNLKYGFLSFFYSVIAQKWDQNWRGWVLLVIPWEKAFKFEHFWKKNVCSKIFKHFWRKKKSDKKEPRSRIYFLGLMDLSRNRLVSTAYQKKPGFSVLHA